ncbi:MAG TPA: cytochrome b/b6 domain-containing protein [bacterium]|nr:cytochrome b/b6 domain-containing protein [bacterium]HPO09449.1 cytochrome b/b6 domain-containing protein [bacterium]
MMENRNTKGPEYIQRFSLNFRIQHIVLFISTTILIITGIPLWCIGRPEYSWSQDIVQAFGAVATIRLIHRIAAIGLTAVSFYHILYLIYTREGRREFIELLPMPKDFVDVTKKSLYFLGLSKSQPRFGRFSYFEKFDYWAVYWGCVIMIGTGLVLWFPEIAAKYIPWLSYELAAEIHADEAILAALAIFIWHFYNVHFNPSRFPGSGLWWHGKMTREQMMEEHPLEYEELMRK